MDKILVLGDLYEATKKELLTNIGLEAKALLLYGSYITQDLRQLADSFPTLCDKNGLLDKKPDYILIVPAINEALNKIGDYYNWEENVLDRLSGSFGDSFMIFNLKTKNSYDIYHHPISQIPYKILLTSEQVFNKSAEFKDHDIFLSSRLSKFLNKAHVSPDFKQNLDEKLGKIQNYFIDLTISTLPQEFKGIDFFNRYLQVTYIAESYRVFDIANQKHKALLTSSVYDIEEKDYIPMVKKLESMLKEKLETRVILKESNDNLCYSTFSRYGPRKTGKLLTDFALFNMNSLANVINKIRVTNSLGGDDNLKYLLRKFR